MSKTTAAASAAAPDSTADLAAQVAALTALVGQMQEAASARETSLEDRIKALTKNEASNLAKLEAQGVEDGLKSAAEAFSATELPEGCVWAQRGADRMAIANHDAVIKEHKALGWIVSAGV